MKPLILSCLLLSRLGAATYTVTASFPNFTPSSLTLSAGDTVHWTGLNAFHNVAQAAADTSSAYDGSGFYSGALNAVATFDLTLSAGTYYYLCEGHYASGMRGALFVLAGPVPTALPVALPGLLGPVPLRSGDPLCLNLADAPRSLLCELYNLRGERVAREKTYAAARTCLSTSRLAAGMYYARIESEDALLAHSVRLQKIVLLP